MLTYIELKEIVTQCSEIWIGLYSRIKQTRVLGC